MLQGPLNAQNLVRLDSLSLMPCPANSKRSISVECMRQEEAFGQKRRRSPGLVGDPRASVTLRARLGLPRARRPGLGNG